MDKSTFRIIREPSWRELENLVKSRWHSFQNIERLNHFIELYQNTANDLSYAQTYFPDDSMTLYLNGLVALAHQRVYRQTHGNLKDLWAFLRSGFARKVRDHAWYLLCSTFIAVAGAIFGYAIVMSRPVNAYHLLPSNFLSGFDPSRTGPHIVDAPILSTYIMTHNMLAVLLCFIGGATLGIFTLYTLWQNGMIIGVLAAIFQLQHKSYIFWSLILPHGVTELSAIFISGAGGLIFAHKLIAPGRFRRIDSVRIGLIDAIQLLLGSFCMLVIAGTIEGFVTPSFLPASVKYGIAFCTFFLWLSYFLMAGRKAPEKPKFLKSDVHTQLIPQNSDSQ